MTNIEMAAELAKWNLPKCPDDWRSVVGFVAGQVTERAVQEFEFVFMSEEGRASCRASIRAENYDEALKKLGSAALPTVLPST